MIVGKVVSVPGSGHALVPGNVKDGAINAAVRSHVLSQAQAAKKTAQPAAAPQPSKAKSAPKPTSATAPTPDTHHFSVSAWANHPDNAQGNIGQAIMDAKGAGYEVHP